MKKPINSKYLFEVTYQNNLGFEEMFKFYQVASPKQISKLETMMDRNEREAWKFVQDVLGVQLQGAQFGN